MNIRLFMAVIFSLASVKLVFTIPCEIQGIRTEYDLHPGTCLELVCKATMGKAADKLVLLHDDVQILDAVNVTSLKFKLTNVTYKDSGKYECRGVKVGVVQFAYFITVNVFAAPKIVSKVYNSSCELPVKIDYVLRCFANGYPRPDIQWLLGNKTIGPEDLDKGLGVREQKGYGRELDIYTGYEIWMPTISCVANNSLGQDRSDSIHIHFKEFPKSVIQIPKKAYIATTNQSITIECRFFKTTQIECDDFNITLAPLYIKWFHGERKLNNYRTNRLSKNNITSKLKIVKVTNDMAGHYMCEISYLQRTYKERTVLVVSQKGLPSIGLTQYRQSTPLGTSVTLTCLVKYTKFDIVKQSWTRNGSIITATKSRYSISTEIYNETDNVQLITNILQIHPFKSDDTGKYTCEVESAVNKTSKSIVISEVNLLTSSKTKMTSLETWQVVIVVITVCSLVGFIAAMSLRYLKRKGRFHRPSQGYKNFVYGSFLAYSDKDFGWIKTELVPLLEKHNVTYCLPFRDYEIGKALIENITDSIYQSHTVIAVISKNFLTSKKCKDELDVALYRVVEKDDNSLVAIRIDSVRKDMLPKALRNRTFLDYTDNEEKKYWDKRLLKHLFREQEKKDLA